MKIKIIFALIVTIGTLGLTGCKPKETMLSGQIFIVTRGSENIKLGLIEVQLIEKQQVAEFLEKKDRIIEPEAISRRNEFDLANLASIKASSNLISYCKKTPVIVRDASGAIAARAKVDKSCNEALNQLLQGNKKAAVLVNAAEEYLVGMENIYRELDPEMSALRESAWHAELRYVTARVNFEHYPTAETYFGDFAPLVIKKR
jgi:hypothetical protein